MVRKLFGYMCIAAAVIIVITVGYLNSHKSDVPIIFSPTQMLEATWLSYKNAYLEPETYRTIDTARGNITTSEGQSYTMLRAAWLGDKKTFDGSWKWTQDNIAHSSDRLFSWLWGKLPDGTYGVLTAQNGQNSASDADSDIALALVFAYARWQDPSYLDAARGIMGDIWDKEVIVINGTPYLTANNVEKMTAGEWALINPSYLNPAAYRIFASVDTAHSWKNLVDSSYLLLSKSTRLPLANTASAGLPPDWIQINKQSGAIVAAPGNGHGSNFGFEAMRVPWRIALDWEWNGDVRAKTLLRNMSFLSSQWSSQQKLATVYGHGGDIINKSETPAMYGGAIGQFMVTDPTVAKNLYEKKLIFLYDPGANAWKQPLSYYDDNWAWFGIALYNRLLPNLAAALPPSAFKVSSLN